MEQVQKKDGGPVTQEIDAIKAALNSVKALKVALTGNLSLGHLKRNEVDEAEFYNGFCLDDDPENVKAHFR